MDKVTWLRVRTLLALFTAEFVYESNFHVGCIYPSRVHVVLQGQTGVSCLSVSTLVHLSSDGVWLIYRLRMKA